MNDVAFFRATLGLTTTLRNFRDTQTSVDHQRYALNEI